MNIICTREYGAGLGWAATASGCSLIYKRDYVSVTLLCHIYDLAMRKI
jgi:hypothetical protein